MFIVIIIMTIIATIKVISLLVSTINVKTVKSYSGTLQHGATDCLVSLIV